MHDWQEVACPGPGPARKPPENRHLNDWSAVETELLPGELARNGADISPISDAVQMGPHVARQMSNASAIC